MRAVEQASARYPCPPLGRKQSAAQVLLRLLADVKGEGAYSNDFVAHFRVRVRSLMLGLDKPVSGLQGNHVDHAFQIGVTVEGLAFLGRKICEGGCDLGRFHRFAVVEHLYRKDRSRLYSRRIDLGHDFQLLALRLGNQAVSMPPSTLRMPLAVITASSQ